MSDWEEVETIVRNDKRKAILERRYQPMYRWRIVSADHREEYGFGPATPDPDQAWDGGLAEMERLTYCRPKK